MIDKKLYEAINENNKKEHTKYVKSEKRKEIISTISIIIGILAISSLVLVLGSVIHQETQKAVKKCVKMGYTIDKCVKDAR